MLATNSVIQEVAPARTDASIWHRQRVLIPRRSITGRPVWGRVWRRWDGQRWIYKTDLDW